MTDEEWAAQFKPRINTDPINGPDSEKYRAAVAEQVGGIIKATKDTERATSGVRASQSPLIGAMGFDGGQVSTMAFAQVKQPLDQGQPPENAQPPPNDGVYWLCNNFGVLTWVGPLPYTGGSGPQDWLPKVTVNDDGSVSPGWIDTTTCPS